jgi:D-3-phosphoglycerate dehydrogenase / 2-oxoglutarate reductase
METKKCLIIDPMHESFFTMLEQIGWAYTYLPAITREDIRQRHRGYHGLIVRSKTVIDRDLLGEHPTLEFVGRAGAGLDNLDLPFLEEKKIRVLHAAEGNRDAVGEFTIGLLLDVLRHISRADSEVKKFIWEREGNRGEELMGKTVSIIGYGNMGQAFARCLSGFRCKILAYDKYKSGFGDTFCEEADMDRVFDETDILSFHIPLTAETRFMANRDYFMRFRKNIIVINTARGEIIPLADLAWAVENQKVRGAALDVLENEKMNSLSPQQQQSVNYLASTSNVIFTPHIAGWTVESHVKINVALVEKIKTLYL